MGLTAWLTRAATGVPVPVFVLEGQGASPIIDQLRLDHRLRLVETPRQANVLLLAGAFCGPLLRPAIRVHDELSHPRCTVWWPAGSATDRLPAGWPGLRIADGGVEHVVQTLLRCHAELLQKELPSDPPLAPDVPPAPWRGVGPYGQGGKGMTGGTPYGRPMAGTAPDRDGLQLDQLPLRVGPFFPPLPPGLMLNVGLQGDVIQDVKIGEIPFQAAGAESTGFDPAGLFRVALTRPVRLADLELARARHHLRWVATALRFHGLGSWSRRVLRLALELVPSDEGAVRSLARTLERFRSLSPATAGVGVLRASELNEMLTGPVARASGRGVDLRLDDPAYRRLGFEPIIQPEGDARARFRQRLGEAAQALALGTRASDQKPEVTGEVESPWGRLSAEYTPMPPLLDLVPRLLAGQEWGDAVTAIVSLDLDLELDVGRSTASREAVA